MGERDLACDERVVVGHVGQQVVKPMLELDVHAAAELVDVEGRLRPIDPDLLADSARLTFSEAVVCHASIVARIAAFVRRVTAYLPAGFPQAQCGRRVMPR